MKNLDFLFAAYTAIWILLFLYISTLSRRNRSLEKEIEELRELLEQRKQRPTL
jgi:CcmD family protein